MSMKNDKSKQKSFYLHSFKNRHLYPASNYPITHLVDHLNIKYRILEQSKYIKHFIYAFIMLIICILFDPITRRNHITTSKQIKRPSIYVKLPAQSQEYFHAHYPIRFQLYSIRTLQCIIKNLPSGSKDIYQTWIEKSNYIEYIYKEYAKNSTEFNKSVLTKCGLLIGHLYRPFYEKAFIPTHQHIFLSSDIALNMTEKYDPFSSFLTGGLIFLWLLFKCLFNLILYLLNNIRLKFYQQIPTFPLELELYPDIIKELSLLNIDGLPPEQLLKFEKLIQESNYKFKNNLFIIENDHKELFVVIFKKIDLNINNKFSPFIICPVTDIQKVTEYHGICYGEDFSRIPWPINEENYAEWLHEKLMEKSDVYKQRYEENQQLSMFTDQPLNCDISTHSIIYQQYLLINKYNSRLTNLIDEENNIQRLKRERENSAENGADRHGWIIPASAEFILKFRLNHEYNKKITNINMVEKQIQCTICLECLELNDQYATWSCSGRHIFHYKCMLNWLRMRNTCPNCRHEV